MRALLTGSAGFIGGAVAEALRDRGDEVVGVDWMLANAHGDQPPVPPQTELLDVRDAATSRVWADLLRGVDAVCHQSALVGAGVTVADLPVYASHNDLGTAALLAGMAEAGVTRLVQASSMVVYGEGRYTCEEHGDQLPGVRTPEALRSGDVENRCPLCDRVLGWSLVEEDARLAPLSAYAASKVAQEHYAVSWARQAGSAAVSLRYHNVYGPLMPQDTPYSGVAAMFRSSLEQDRAPQVYEDGGQMRDFVHVADVARANLAALDAVLAAPAGSHAAFNVCSGTPVSILDVARTVAAGTGREIEPEVTGDFRLGDVRHIVASPHRARDGLGFVASIAPGVGLREFANAPLRD